MVSVFFLCVFLCVCVCVCACVCVKQGQWGPGPVAQQPIFQTHSEQMNAPTQQKKLQLNIFGKNSVFAVNEG